MGYLHLAGEDEEAIAPLEAALQLQPALLPANLFLGASNLRLGRAAAAIAPLQRAVRLDPANRDARSMLAEAEPIGSGRPGGVAQPGQRLRGAGVRESP